MRMPEERMRRMPPYIRLRTQGVPDELVFTWAQLNRRANQLAHHLRELGVGLDDRVGIALE